MLKYRLLYLIIIALTITISSYAKNPVKIKDLAVIQGVRENQLMGIGLVTGLQGMGDSKDFKLTKKMLSSLTSNWGFDIKEDEIKSKNVAAVLVTANIGGFARSGDKLNITISSVGDAKSLSGGILLQTALKAADGNIYAVAQGRLIAGNKEQNSETSASIPDGAIVEKDIISSFKDGNKISVILKNPDFTTVNLIKEAVTGLNPDIPITAKDAGLIEITLGEEEQKNPIDFISKLEVLTVTPDNINLVIIDKKSGIIVSGSEVVIQECEVSTPSVGVKVNNNKDKKNNFSIKGQTVGDLINILNEAGLNTNEIISLIETIYKAGALNAKIILL